MPVSLKQEPDSKLLSVDVSGKLDKGDYDKLAPEVEKLIEKNGKIDILLKMHDFHGWRMGALWRDIKFDMKHYSDIRRLAMVGDKTWEKWMATACRPFTKAEIKYFDEKEEQAAREWVGAA
ncbi:MAG TPA: STAS/SEC14 domain-containing protein [Planctomycetota bacterium]|jgi:hypothetical protein